MNQKQADSKDAIEITPYSRLVSLPIHSDNIFYFPEGIPAFEHIKQFVFVFKPDTRPFVFMHALEPADLAFVCVDPFLISDDYKPKVSEADSQFLHAKSSADLAMLSIVTVTPDEHDITANLQGPIVINMQACIGKQIICDGSEYPIRYRIWDALSNLKKNEAAAAREAMVNAQ